MTQPNKLMREALERSHNHLKYQYETDKQRTMRLPVHEQSASLCGLNMLASVLKQNEEALSNKQSATKYTACSYAVGYCDLHQPKHSEYNVKKAAKSLIAVKDEYQKIHDA